MNPSFKFVGSMVIAGAAVALAAACLGPGTLKQSQCEASAKEVVQASCLSCHSSTLSGTQRAGAPLGVNFDTDGDLLKHAARIRDTTMVKKTMPPGTPLAECAQKALGEYLTTLEQGPCIKACSGRVCGDDGCGGSCGVCDTGQTCNAVTGQCSSPNCTPDCTGAACGSDGCGGVCGALDGGCTAGNVCSADRKCVCQPQCGLADGGQKQCGLDGCGGFCGVNDGGCIGNQQCSQQGLCVCIPSCKAPDGGTKQCGDDGCGGACGTCATDFSCNTTSFACECSTTCPATKKCGLTSCGFNCGGCTNPALPYCKSSSPTVSSCSAVCTPNCAGKVCGDDGCGGSCGGCGSGQTCNASGQCVCAPNCAGKTCGPDGCGGVCGSLDGGCSSGLVCNSAGQCGCDPTGACQGRVCGSDGCGGSCPPDACADAGQICGTNGQCVCAPQCAGKQCGSDGCGGSCGSCSSTQTCNAGTCAYAKKTYAADVHPVFQPNCATAGCHTGGAVEPLDFRTASAGYASLIDKPSAQCANKVFVKKNDIAASYLVNKLTGSGMCFGSQMPKGGTALPAAQLDIIRAWIATGADP